MNHHLRQAIHHLSILSNEKYDHLLWERNYTEWHLRVLSSARASAALALLTEGEEVRAEKTELWALPDS